MKNSIYLILLLTVLCSSFSIAQTSTIHMVIFADTHDESIGKTCKMDLTKMKKQAKKYAHYSEMELKTYYNSGSSFTKQRLHSILNSMNVQKNDAVFFYYTGHGYRAENTQSPFPILSLKNSGSSHGVSVSWLRNRIKTMNPRLSIVFIDACNTLMNITHEEDVAMGIKSKDQYKRLFREARGEVVMAGSKKGTKGSSYEGYSLCNMVYGGFFTYSYIEQFEEMIKQTEMKADWNTLAKKSKDATINFTKNRQIPYYEVNVKYGY